MIEHRTPIDAGFVGRLVIAEGGEILGRVADVRNRYFKVNAPMHRDYWLDMDCIRTTLEGEVFLSVDKSDLDAYTVAGPAPL